MRLWDKGKSGAQKVHDFTVGDDYLLDMRLAKYDVQGSIAHAQMLKHIGILTDTEEERLLNGLCEISTEIERGEFAIPSSFEDVHSYVEYVLTSRLGDVGRKIHTGRSRNDQVLVDMHLYAKDALRTCIHNIHSVANLLLDLAHKHQDIFLPGYTHTQIAMPASFGLWLGAYAEALADDLIMLNAAFKIADQNPLGSAAGYGSSFPLDRQLTTKLLGFSTLKFNSIAAQMGRGRLELAMAQAFSAVALTLGRLAADIVLYNSQNFAFISFPDELTTGSSIMPHKKNPDIFELIRGKCNIICTVPSQLTSILANLTSGYHRDFQLFKKPLFTAIDDLQMCLDILAFALPDMQVNKAMADDPRYKDVFTVDAVNQLVMQGSNFRDAYREIGKAVEEGRFERPSDLQYTHIGSTGNPAINEIREKLKHVITQNSMTT